ncbi:MAG: iron ABC transporter permease [Eubacterium sp.]|nr:iron ABC transporter permease [Eubacterium sp.]
MRPIKEKTSRFHFDIKWVFIFVILAFLLVFLVFPLLYLLFRSFFVEGSFTLDAVKRIYTYSLNWSALKNTLVTASLSMVFGVLIAFPLAWLVSRTNLLGKGIFRSIFVMTYMVPPYVGAMAWTRLLNPKVGTINQILTDLFGLSESPFDIYTTGGMVWVLTTFYYPFAFITLCRALEHMDPSLEEAARISGASPLKTLFTVTLPMMLPAIGASAIMVFIAAASCYGIPSIVGAPGRIYTVTTRIAEYVATGTSEGLTDATVLSLFLMVLSLLLLFISNFVLGRRDHITISGKSVRPNIVDLRKWRIPLTIVVGLFSVIVVVIPFLSVISTSFTLNMGKSVFASGNATLNFWGNVFSRSSILKSALNSLLAAFIAATLGMIICVIMAYLLKRTNMKGRRIPDFLIAVGSGTPSIVIGLALIMTMSGKFGINIYNTLLIMIIAYMIKYMTMGMRTVVSGFSQIGPALEEAAAVSGAGWFRRMRDVVLPMLLPSIVAGWFLIFMPSFYELTMSNLLYSEKTQTLGVELYLYQVNSSQQTAAALACCILLLVLIMNLVMRKVTKGKFSL